MLLGADELRHTLSPCSLLMQGTLWSITSPSEDHDIHLIVDIGIQTDDFAPVCLAQDGRSFVVLHFGFTSPLPVVDLKRGMVGLIQLFS